MSFNINTRKAMVMVYGMLILSLIRSGNEEKAEVVSSSIEEQSNDENMNSVYILNELDKLNQYVDLSDDLHDLSFDRNYISNDKELLSPDRIRGMMDAYSIISDNDRDIHFLDRELSSQEYLVNQYINEKGSYIIGNAYYYMDDNSSYYYGNTCSYDSDRNEQIKYDIGYVKSRVKKG